MRTQLWAPCSDSMFGNINKQVVLSEYAEGYLDGVTDSSTGETDFTAVEQTFTNRAYSKMFQLLKAEKQNAEINLKVEGHTEEYYAEQKLVIKIVNTVIDSLTPRYYVEIQDKLVESFFLGYNQGIFDGQSDRVVIENLFSHVDILDGRKEKTHNFDNMLLNDDYYAGYYCGVMETAPMVVVRKMESKIREYKEQLSRLL